MKGTIIKLPISDAAPLIKQNYIEINFTQQENERRHKNKIRVTDIELVQFLGSSQFIYALTHDADEVSINLYKLNGNDFYLFPNDTVEVTFKIEDQVNAEQ